MRSRAGGYRDHSILRLSSTRAAPRVQPCQETIMNARNTQSPKVAVVTGAGSGIGLAVAHRLLGAGFSVVLNGRDEGKLARAARELDAGDRVAVSPGHVG